MKKSSTISINNIFLLIAMLFLSSASTKSLAQADSSKAYTKLDRVGKYFLLRGRLYNEKEITPIFLSLNNTEITRCVQKAKNQRKWQYIGFAAIPAVIGSYYCKINANGLYDSTKRSKAYDKAGNGLIFFAGACLTASIVFKIKRSKSMSRAGKIYQQTY